MNDRRALLRAILTNPADNSLRLAFADWLEEHGTGDADAARVEFVRLWYRLRPTLRSTTRTIAKWLGANWPRLWPSVVAQATDGQTHFRAQGRSLAGRLVWEANAQQRISRVKVYFDRGFAECVQYDRGAGYERFAAAFAADEPLARFEPMNYLPAYGPFPTTNSVARIEDWGEQVFARLTGFVTQPSPSEKVFDRGATPSGGHSDDRGWRAVAAAMTAIAREKNGLADPITPPEPS